MEAQKGHHFINWARAYSSDPENYYQPESRDHIRQILSGARERKEKVRVVGNGHSPSDLACTPDNMVSLTKMNKVLHIDKDNCRVKVEAGILIADLNEVLNKNGLAFSVLGSVDDVSIGGVISTATHGTGAQFKCLSHYVVEMEIMKASGEVMTISRDVDEAVYRAACVSMGCFGVILTVTLQCEKAFNLHKTYSPATLDQVLSNLEENVQMSEHFRFVWFPYSGVVVEHSSRTTKEPFNDASWFWDMLIGFHLLQFLFWLSTFWDRLVPLINRVYYWMLHSSSRQEAGVSYELFSFECLFKQDVTEWAISRDKTCVVLRELRAWMESCTYPAHFPIEVRFVKGDDLMLSPTNGRESCYINIVNYRPYGKMVPYEKYFYAFETILKKHGGRPHWAKVHHVTPEEFSTMYSEWSTFCQLRRTMDPQAMFINKNLERVFGVNL